MYIARARAPKNPFVPPYNLVPRVFVPYCAWLDETSDSNLVPRASFPLTSGRKTRALGATISGMRHRCRCAVSRITGIRLFPLFFHNGCSQSSRFPTAGQGERSSGNEIGATLERSVRGAVLIGCSKTMQMTGSKSEIQYGGPNSTKNCPQAWTVNVCKCCNNIAFESKHPVDLYWPKVTKESILLLL